MKKLVFIFSFLWQFSACIGGCYDMKQTIQTVSGCPSTEAEWNVRAALKNCAAMCSDFSYHCLITKEMNAMIEVCAEPKYIQGYCTYFDTADDRIKGLYAADCSKYQNPCPTRYHSTKAFQYQDCYDLVRAYVTVHPSSTSSTPVNTNTLTNSTGNSSNNTSEEKSITTIVIALVLVLIVITVVIFGVVIFIRRGKCSFLRRDAESGNFYDATKTEGGDLEEEENLLDGNVPKVEDEAPDFTAEIRRLKEEYEAKLAEVNKEIEILKSQTEKDMDDKEKLMRQVLEKNKECKTLNNRLQEAKGNIRVLCRIRKSESTNCLSATKTTVIIDRNTDPPKKFPFERVFDANSTQEVVYEEISELIRSFLDGYNLCIFAYGQTGSGKTYTMEGPQGKNEEMKHQGIIPRAMKQVFRSVEDFKVCGWTYQFRASYFELYNEAIQDLAKGSNDEGKNLTKGATENNRTSKPIITEKEVKTTEEVMKFYEESSKNRTSAKTARNERSSRSHAIFRLKMNGKVENIEGSQDTCSGTMTLVDLAGSERLDDSANISTNTETKKINLSLLELTKVLRSLRRKEKPVYRNSKLTHLLQDSLGGNSKTLMIVNVSPSEDCLKETERTLEFGREVSKVVLENVARKNK